GEQLADPLPKCRGDLGQIVRLVRLDSAGIGSGTGDETYDERCFQPFPTIGAQDRAVRAENHAIRVQACFQPSMVGIIVRTAEQAVVQTRASREAFLLSLCPTQKTTARMPG